MKAVVTRLRLTKRQLEKFWAFVQKPADDQDACWTWQGMTTANGYGRISFALAYGQHVREIRAHRVAYILTHGSVSPDLVIDHLCRNRLCVNPAHLEAVTDRVNILRGAGLAAQYAARTHCARGHDLMDPANTRTDPDRSRKCRACERLRDQARRKGTTLTKLEAQQKAIRGLTGRPENCAADD